MSELLVAPLMAAVDQRDLDAVVAHLAPDARLLITDGRRAQGAGAARQLLERALAGLRSSTHTITAEWHLHGVWIADVDPRQKRPDGSGGHRSYPNSAATVLGVS